MPGRARLPVAEISLVGVAAVWGLTFPMVQDAVALLPVFAFLAYRFLPAAALVAILFRRRLSDLGCEGLRSGVVMGAFLTGGYAFQTVGLQYTSSAKAGFITGMFVVVTPVLGALLLRQRVSRVVWAAAGAALTGLFLLAGPGGRSTVLGDGLVFLCACSFALHILATGRAVERHGAGALLVVQLTVCGVFCLAVALAAGDLEAPAGAAVWSALAVTSLLATALGFFVQTYAQRHTSPARTALILASEPAFAGLFAYVLKGETLTPAGWLGALMILGAIVAVELIPYLRPPRPLPEG